MRSADSGRSPRASPTCWSSGQSSMTVWLRAIICSTRREASASGSWDGPPCGRYAMTPSRPNGCACQIGVMLGPGADLEDVASFLGETPPEGMPQEEFALRVREMRDSLKSKEASFVMLKGYVARAIRELRAHQAAIEELAERRLEDATAGAGVEATPEGTRISNYILNNEKGCDAALRRLEIMRKPDRPGPKRGAQPTVAAAAAAAAGGEPGAVDGRARRGFLDSRSHCRANPAEPGADFSTVEAIAEPTPRRAQGADFSTVEAIAEPTPDEPGADFSTVEAIAEPTPDEPGADFSTVEAIAEPTPAEPGADFSTVEAIAEPTPAEPDADFSTVEAIAEPTPDEPDADHFPVAPVFGNGAKEPDFERFGPHAEHLRQVYRYLQATYGAAEPIDAAGAEPACRGGRLAEASSGLEPGDGPRPGTHPDHAAEGHSAFAGGRALDAQSTEAVPPARRVLWNRRQPPGPGRTGPCSRQGRGGPA